MTIGKNILSMTLPELDEFVAVRQAARHVTPKRKPTRKTVKGLASAWSVPEAVVAAVIKRRTTP